MCTEGDAFLKIYPALAGPRCGGANFVKSVSLSRSVPCFSRRTLCRWLLWFCVMFGNKNSNSPEIKYRTARKINGDPIGSPNAKYQICSAR